MYCRCFVRRLCSPLGAVKNPELYKCVIAGNGYMILKVLLNMTCQKLEFIKNNTEYLDESIGSLDSENDVKNMRDHSPVHFADEVIAPVLLIGGTDDNVVPFRQTKKMYKALKKAGKDVSF